MNFDPQKFFIGLMDFFSILLPGALLTFLLMEDLGPVVLGNRYAGLGAAQGWAVFLFASYLLGHFVFLLGSGLDPVYDRARRHTLGAHIAELARGGDLPRLPARVLARLVFKNERNLAVDRACGIKNRTLAPLRAQGAVNTFQWCKALLNLECPASLAVIQRFEADSKFFRCFTVVLLLLLASWPLQDRWPVTGLPAVLLLLLLALWRYMEQRHKATNQAYWSVITLAARTPAMHPPDAAPAAGNAPVLAGVVVRTRRGVTEYLVVEGTDDPAHPIPVEERAEMAERPREAIVRTVLERAGVWARVVADLGTVPRGAGEAALATRYHLMEYVGRRPTGGRGCAWRPLQDVLAELGSPVLRRLLQEDAYRRSRS